MPQLLLNSKSKLTLVYQLLLDSKSELTLIHLHDQLPLLNSKSKLTLVVGTSVIFKRLIKVANLKISKLMLTLKLQLIL